MLALGLEAVAVLRTAVEGTARDVGGTGVESEVVSAFSAILRGDFDLGGAPLPFALRKGEAVRCMLLGVPVREGGLLGLLIAGLSHDEKKSSLGSPTGVFVPEPASSASSSTLTSSGNLLPTLAPRLVPNTCSLYIAKCTS